MRLDNRARVILILMFLVGVAVILLIAYGCATFDVKVPNTPTAAFNEASASFESAWDAYHLVWENIPKDDPRKNQWLKEYHPKFLEASKFLLEWGKNYADPTKPVGWDVVYTEVRNVGIKLGIQWAIKKGAK